MTEVAEVTAFQAACHTYAAEILVSPAAHALVTLARRAIGELVAANQRLETELDGYRGRTVFHAADSQLEYMAANCCADAQPGDILRATDTGREMFCLSPGRWEPRNS